MLHVRAKMLCNVVIEFLWHDVIHWIKATLNDKIIYIYKPNGKDDDKVML